MYERRRQREREGKGTAVRRRSSSSSSRPGTVTSLVPPVSRREPGGSAMWVLQDTGSCEGGTEGLYEYHGVSANPCDALISISTTL